MESEVWEGSRERKQEGREGEGIIEIGPWLVCLSD